MKEHTQMRDLFLVMCVGKHLEDRTTYVTTSIFTQKKNLISVKIVRKDSVRPGPWQYTRFYTVRHTVISAQYVSKLLHRDQVVKHTC